MAIVFVSPRRKQIIFSALIVSVFILIIIVIALIIFLSKPTPVLESQVFKKPNININLSVLDSDELKALTPMPEMEYNFIYQASDKSGKVVVGNVLAVLEKEAIAKLEAMDLHGISVVKEQTGRDNPFGVYYQKSIIKTK